MFEQMGGEWMCHCQERIVNVPCRLDGSMHGGHSAHRKCLGGRIFVGQLGPRKSLRG